MNSNKDRSLSGKKIEDMLGKPPFRNWRSFLYGSTLLMVGLLLFAMLGGGSFNGHRIFGFVVHWQNGAVSFWAMIFFWLGCLIVPFTLFFGLLDAICMRKPYSYNLQRLLRGEVFPDFYMPKKTLGGHFLFVDRTLGRLYTSHSNYKDGYPINDLYQLTCGFEGKRHFMVLRFRSGDSPELHITARTQKDANQQIIRLQNFLGWN